MRTLERTCAALFAAGLLWIAPQSAEAQSPVFEVHFATGSSSLNSEANGVLDAAAQEYVSSGAATVTIVGHTDTVGNADFNRRLSERRAESVRSGLAQRGVPDGAMNLGATGESDLAVPTGDGVDNRENRRVTIALSAPPPPPPAPAPAPAPMVEPLGDVTVAIAPYFAYNNQDNQDSYFAGANLTLGYQLTPNVLASLEQAVFIDFNGGVSDGIGGRTAAGLDFGFPFGGDILPYIGANVGGIYTDGRFGSSFFAGPEIGVNFGFISVKAAYDMPFDRGADEGVFSFTIGALFRF